MKNVWKVFGSLNREVDNTTLTVEESGRFGLMTCKEFGDIRVPRSVEFLLINDNYPRAHVVQV